MATPQRRGTLARRWRPPWATKALVASRHCRATVVETANRRARTPRNGEVCVLGFAGYLSGHRSQWKWRRHDQEPASPFFSASAPAVAAEQRWRSAARRGFAFQEASQAAAKAASQALARWAATLPNPSAAPSAQVQQSHIPGLRYLRAAWFATRCRSRARRRRRKRPPALHQSARNWSQSRRVA